MTTEKINVEKLIAGDFQTAEAIKTIRTNLIFCGSAVKAIALTSVSMGEGKSTIAFQLAASMAQTGKRVLLLDTDLRGSVLVKRFGIHSNLDGLSHCLSGQADPNDILHPTDVPGLYVIFAGKRVINPSELLNGAAFKSFISNARKLFDYIILDTPPLGQVIDCAVIAPLIDGVVMVIDAGNNNYKLEQKIKAQLEKTGGKILGVILNNVNLKEMNGYYGKSYYGRYGYGYGYGNQKKDDSSGKTHSGQSSTKD